MEHSLGAAFFAVVLVGLSALGLFFVLHKHAGGAPRAFGVVILATALSWLFVAVLAVIDAQAEVGSLSLTRLVMSTGNIVAGIGLGVFVFLYLGQPAGRMWWALATSLTAGLLLASPYVWLIVKWAGTTTGGDSVLIGSFAFSGVLVGGTMFFIALNYPLHGGDKTPFGELGFLSAGIYLFGSPFLLVQSVFAGVLFQEVLFTATIFVFLVGLTGVWVYNASLPAPASRVARNVALLVPAVPVIMLFVVLVALDFFIQGFPEDGLAFGLLGFLMLSGLLVVSYSVLHQRFLGISLRVRWGVSKGFLAGFFIAVFFVVGEAAEAYFGGILGTYAGILAAGLLIFAIAPLQRLADNLSRYTVPAAFSGTSQKRREEIYRHALRGALKDRAVSEKEEIRLAELAEELGIGAGRAATLLSEARRTFARAPDLSAGGV